MKDGELKMALKRCMERMREHYGIGVQAFAKACGITVEQLAEWTGEEIKQQPPEGKPA